MVSLFSEMMSFPSEVDFYLMDYVRSDHDEPGLSRKLSPQRRRRKHSRAWSIFQQFYNPNQVEQADDLLENDLMESKSTIALDSTTSTNADTTALNVTDEIGATKETVNEQQIQSAPDADEAVEKSPPSDVDSQPATEEIITGIVTNEADETSNRKLMSSHLRHKRHQGAWSVLQNLFNPQWETDEESESSKKKESGEIEFLQVGTESSDTGNSPFSTSIAAAAQDRPIEFLSLSNNADVESSTASNVTIIASLNDTVSAVNETLSTMNNNATTIPTWTNITTVALNSTTVVDNSNSTFIVGVLGNSTSTWSNSSLTVGATNVTSIDITDKSNSTTVVSLGNNSTLSSSSNSTLTSTNTTSIDLNSNTTSTSSAAANSTTIIIAGGNNSTTIVVPSSVNATDVTAAANNNTTTTNSSGGNAATSFPSSRPSLAPTSWPTLLPSSSPSSMPSSWPTFKPSRSIFEPSSRPSAAPSLRTVLVNESGAISHSLSKSAIAGLCFALLFALAGCYVIFSQVYDANNRHRKGAKRLEDESPGPLPLDTVRSFNELYASDDEEEGHNDSVPLASRYGASGSSYKQRVRVPQPLAISSVGYNY